MQLCRKTSQYAGAVQFRASAEATVLTGDGPTPRASRASSEAAGSAARNGSRAAPLFG